MVYQCSLACCECAIWHYIIRQPVYWEGGGCIRKMNLFLDNFAKVKFDIQEDIALKTESDTFNGKEYSRLRVGPYDAEAEAHSMSKRVGKML